MDDQWENGEIVLDSEYGKALGFTSDKFDGWLWLHGDVIHVSFIESLQKGQGNFSKLLEALWARGYTVKVPTVSRQMQAILERKGFTPMTEYDADFDADVDLWVKPPHSSATDDQELVPLKSATAHRNHACKSLETAIRSEQLSNSTDSKEHSAGEAIERVMKGYAALFGADSLVLSTQCALNGMVISDPTKVSVNALLDAARGVLLLENDVAVWETRTATSTEVPACPNALIHQLFLGGVCKGKVEECLDSKLFFALGDEWADLDTAKAAVAQHVRS